MADIVIYTTTTCPFCVRAKRLLSQKGQAFEEINVADADTRAKMIERAGGSRTVPQIFINGRHIGGCDDLYALEQDGKLDGLLAA